MRPAGRRRHIPPVILAVMLDYRHSQRREVALPGFPAPPGSLTAMRGRGRDAGEVYGSPAKGWGGIDGKQDGWSVRDRGGGTSSPSPSAPPPMAISPRSSARGDPGEEPGTAAHRFHPGYGCLPDIRPGTAHAPRKGAGEERRRHERGGGCRQKCTGILCRRREWGGAAGKERMDIPSRTRRRRRQYSSLGTGPNVFWNSWQHYRV